MQKRLNIGRLKREHAAEVRMVGNFFELGLVYSANLLLPLVVTPYLVRTVGVERVGVIALAQALAGFMAVVTDYGFSLTAVREVSIHRDDPRALRTLWSEVLAIKTGLVGLGLAVLGGLVFLIPDFHRHAVIYAGAGLLLLGQTLLPTWFFQGVEWVRPLTWLNVSAKLGAGLLILVVVRKPEDAGRVNLLLGLSALLPALACWALARRRFGVREFWPTRAALVQRLAEGFPVLMSSLSGNLYTHSNLLLLRLFTDNTVVGYYSVVERIMLTLRQVNSVYSQVTYPRACKIASEDPGRLLPFYRRFVPPFLALQALFLLGLLVGDEALLRLFIGQATPEALRILGVLRWMPLVVALNIPFCQLLLIGEHRYTYGSILTAGALLCIGLNALLASRFGAIGTAWAVLLTESLMTAVLIGAVERKARRHQLLRSPVG
jgi:PST family polysaccharide transporter